MRLKSLFKDLEYIGEAEGDRLSYAVFRGPEAYLVVAPNSRGGLNVNVVKREILEVIRKRFRGDIEGCEGGEVRLLIDNPEGGKEKLLIGLPFGDIAEAKLVMTDRLLEAAQALRPKAEAMGDGSEWPDEIQPVPVTDRRQ